MALREERALLHSANKIPASSEQNDSYSEEFSSLSR